MRAIMLTFFLPASFIQFSLSLQVSLPTPPARTEVNTASDELLCKGMRSGRGERGGGRGGGLMQRMAHCKLA